MRKGAQVEEVDGSEIAIKNDPFLQENKLFARPPTVPAPQFRPQFHSTRGDKPDPSAAAPAPLKASSVLLRVCSIPP
jgi:hypothetical protein